MDNIKIEIPKKSEFLSCIRLTTSSILNIKSFNIEIIEDVKVLVSEICTFFISNISNTEKPFLIDYFLEDSKITIDVIDKNEEFLSKDAVKNSEMFVLIIDSLADSYNIDYKNNKITFILQQ